MTEPVAKTRPCSKCKEPIPEGVNPCPACGAWQRKFTLRTVAHSLTVGKRPEDKTVRKTTAAVGGSGAVVALFFHAISAYQGEAKASREANTKNIAVMAASLDRSTAATERNTAQTAEMTTAIKVQTVVLQEVATATRETVTVLAVQKAQAPIPPVSVEARPVRRR